MIVLKLFSGPQVGGEAVLSPGEYLLGRDATCDIVIDDVLVEPQHCRLIITDDSVELESLGGQVYVEGQLFERGRVELFDYIMIGGSCFALGSTLSQWPARPIPDIRRTSTPTLEDGSTNSADALASPLQAANDAQVDSPLYSESLGPDVTRSRQVLSWFCWLVGLTSLFAVSLLAAQRGDRDQPSDVAEDKPPLDQRLWEIARSQSFESDIQIEKSNRGWTVVGYLDHRADRQRLFDEFRKVLPATAIKLWDSESLAESAQDVLGGLHVPLTAKAGPPGAVTIAGTVKSLDQWRAVRERILRDVSAIRQLDDQAVVSLDSQKATAQLRPVSIESTSPTESETVPAATEAAGASTTVVPEIQPAATIVRNVYLLPADAEAPPRPNPSIRSVNVGACQSLVTTEGTRVMKGGRLDGWMVMEIAEDKIVLERGKYRHIVDLLAP